MRSANKPLAANSSMPSISLMKSVRVLSLWAVFFFISSTDIDPLRRLNVLNKIKIIDHTQIQNRGVEPAVMPSLLQNEAGEFVF